MLSHNNKIKEAMLTYDTAVLSVKNTREYTEYENLQRNKSLIAKIRNNRYELISFNDYEHFVVDRAGIYPLPEFMEVLKNKIGGGAYQFFPQTGKKGYVELPFKITSKFELKVTPLPQSFFGRWGCHAIACLNWWDIEV